MREGNVAKEQRQPLPASNATVAARQRIRYLEATVFHRAKDRCKDTLKTYIKIGAPSDVTGDGSETALLANTITPQGRRGLFPANRTAFLKIDDCRRCHRAIPWEWVPGVLWRGRPLTGTAVWCSQLTEGLCSHCVAALELLRQNERRVRVLRQGLIQLLGGERPYRDFTFERYRVDSGNRLAFERAKEFAPSRDNLY